MNNRSVRFLLFSCYVACIILVPYVEVVAQININAIEDAALEVESVINLAEKIYSNCFSIPNSLCLGGTSQIITANGIPEGLSGWWTFDEIYPVDHSGHANDMHRAPRAGPGYNGRGASAAFLKGAGGVVKSSNSLESPQFTISFWIYLLGDSTGLWRNIVSKGNDASQTPTILLYPNSRKLSIRITTDDSSSEGFASKGNLVLRRWTHVAVTCSEDKLKLFINGVKDNETTLRGNVMTNKGNLVVGGTLENGGFDGYLDELRYYSRALQDAEVSSLALASLTGVPDSSMVSVGCDSCTFVDAMQSNICGDPTTHLCSLQELYQGGMHIARVNGWLSTVPDIWHSDMIAGDASPGEERMAICCHSRLQDFSETSPPKSE